MKKSIFGKVGAAAVVLTLVTASLVGGTFAKYTTTVNGEANAKVAKWGVTFTDGQNSITESSSIVLTPSSETGKALNTIIPGDDGEFKVVVDGSSAEVDFKYEIEVAAKTEKDKELGIKFYKTKAADGTFSDPIEAGTVLAGEILYNAENKTVEVPIYWELPAGTGATDELKDAADTAMAGSIANFTIGLHAEQKTTTP